MIAAAKNTNFFVIEGGSSDSFNDIFAENIEDTHVLIDVLIVHTSRKTSKIISRAKEVQLSETKYIGWLLYFFNEIRYYNNFPYLKRLINVTE